MRHALILLQLLTLQADIGIDHVVVEHPPLRQKRTIFIQRIQRSAQRAANIRDLVQLLLAQGVQILIARLAGVNLVFDTVQARHQHGRKHQVGVRRRIGKPHLDAPRRFGRGGNATRRRAVARRVCQQHGCLEARHQTLVAVRRRVGKGVQHACMLQDSADVVQGDLGQIGIALAQEGVLAVLPQGLMDMHARSVVAENGLRHEGGGLAVRVGDHLYAVLVDLQVIGDGQQTIETNPDLVLRGRHFVMMFLDLDAARLHGGHHLGAQVERRIDGGYGKIAAFGAGTMSEVSLLVVARAVVGTLFGIDLSDDAMAVRGETHVVEDEELRLGTEVSGVGDPCRAHVVSCSRGDRTRIAVVKVAVRGVLDRADQDQRVLRCERIDEGCGRIGMQDHVRFVNVLPAGNRRAVEHHPLFEKRLVDRRDMLRRVVPLSAKVGKTQIDIVNFLVF